MSIENKNIIPVIIGCDRKLVSELHRKYRTKVHIFGDSCGFLVRLLPYTRFHLVWEMTPETLSMYINGFAESNPDHIPAVTSAVEYADMLDAAETEIECSCIILREGIEL